MATPAPNRRQSTRQVRTSVSRPLNYYARPFTSRGHTLEQGTSNNAAPGFFPATQHFTDCLAALPREVMKHFSMMKEVEAKLHDPDERLKLALDKINCLPTPVQGQTYSAQNPFPGSTAANSANVSYNGSVNGATPMHHNQAVDVLDAAGQPEQQAQSAVNARVALFAEVHRAISEILHVIPEKIAIYDQADLALKKQTARMDSSWPYMELEFTEEARLGSSTHWAYTDKESKKVLPPTNDRSRREVASANNLAAAAMAVHEGDIAATRSEARREAMLANKRHRNQHLDSDFDDRPPPKKVQPRPRKPVETNIAPEGKIQGLGITNGTSHVSKKRKTEKEKAIPPPMERSMSGAMAQAGRTNAGSPRETLATESTRKKKAPASTPSLPKKKLPAGGANSPPVASSPLVGSFGPSRDASQRPQSSRVRQNSATNSIISAAQDASRVRPSSSASNRPLNGTSVYEQMEQIAGMGGQGLRSAQVTPRLGPAPDVTPSQDTLRDVPTIQETSTLKREDNADQNFDDAYPQMATAPPVTTRAGRTSKTATPITSAFPDIPLQRSRSTRNANNNSSHASSVSDSQPVAPTSTVATATITQKRSHKKGAGLAAQAAQKAAQELEEDGHSGAEGSDAAIEEEVDEDGDEPRYCYCNGVSYGEMIACDNENCSREWFHLSCAKLQKPPSSKEKWYCRNCAPAFEAKKEGKKARPGSR
ncbi:hypothetical protein M501DRAFT_928077 [Patellaria atrata CBS 101060]|uniref:Chromatin modification-related protein n=1 Tax=Patellaria atrata CBS 101060 TaxID=1346257 RepID=A0A9P4SHB8_9PEZI|nr:hypothetical protein M501DRAFT_928077 [Patellaria atrata CBS 101060]